MKHQELEDIFIRLAEITNIIYNLWNTSYMHNAGTYAHTKMISKSCITILGPLLAKDIN